MPQSLSQLWVHIVFSTKKRYPFLQDMKLRQRVHCYLKSICYQLGCAHTVVGGIKDHVHLLVNLPKNLSVSTLIENLKKSSSKWIKTLNKTDVMLGKFYWQSGYGAFSVSHSKINIIENYIKAQDKHHQNCSVQDEFRQLLMRHKIPYKEEYVWD